MFVFFICVVVVGCGVFFIFLVVGIVFDLFGGGVCVVIVVVVFSIGVFFFFDGVVMICVISFGVFFDFIVILS